MVQLKLTKTTLGGRNAGSNGTLEVIREPLSSENAQGFKLLTSKGALLMVSQMIDALFDADAVLIGSSSAMAAMRSALGYAAAWLRRVDTRLWKPDCFIKVGAETGTRL